MAKGDAVAATRGITGYVGAVGAARGIDEAVAASKTAAAARQRSPSKVSQRPGPAALDPKLRWTAHDEDEEEHRADDAGTTGDPVVMDADAVVAAPHRVHGELISTTPWNPLYAPLVHCGVRATSCRQPRLINAR
jgi:hypothetical protein